LPTTDRIAKAVWGSFAGRCTICREAVIAETPASNTSLVGEVAHMVGEKKDAPRGGSAMPIEERNGIANLLLLCRRHHKIVDDHPTEFTVERLRELRSDFLVWLDRQLAPSTEWECRLSALFYINVPRLGEYALQKGYDLTPKQLIGHENLSELGFGLVQVMHAYARALSSLPIDSVTLDDMKVISERYIAALTHFERRNFRTKNIGADSIRAPVHDFTGDLKQDPHIYTHVSNWKFIILIDRRWITTNTARAHFRPSSGQVQLSGFARINHLDFTAREIYASGLVMGLPPSPLDEVLKADAIVGVPPSAKIAMRTNNESEHLAFFKDLEDDETKAIGGIWYDPPTKCDFCSRLFATQTYMVDGPEIPGGPWGNMCQECYLRTHQPLGVGKGQLYKQIEGVWHMVGGYSESTE
jgi:hypothetical protein